MASIKEMKSILFSRTNERSFSSEMNQYGWINEFLKSKKGFSFFERDSDRIPVSPARMMVSVYQTTGSPISFARMC